MSHASLPNELWEEIEPLFYPDEVPGSQGGRPRALNRIAMRGIFFVLCTGTFAGKICPRSSVAAE